MNNKQMHLSVMQRFNDDAARELASQTKTWRSPAAALPTAAALTAMRSIATDPATDEATGESEDILRQQHVHRFMRMAGHRRRHILEKMLLDA